MGNGDKKSKKGKLFQGSFGNSRPKNKRNKAAQLSNSLAAEVTTVVKPVAAKKEKATKAKA
jgi:ribosomal small subunit protein bTHX